MQKIIAEKPLNIIISQTTTESVNIMMEQMSKTVAAVKTTAWEGKNVSSEFFLDKDDRKTIPIDVGGNNRLTREAGASKGINYGVFNAI